MTSPSDRLAEIERLVERSARDPRTHTFAQLADLYRETGQVARALEVIEAGLRHHPHYVNARLVHARVLQEMGRSDEAVRAFERVLEIDSENRAAKEALAGLIEGVVEPARPQDDEPVRLATGWLARLDAEWRHDAQPRTSPPPVRPSPPPARSSPPQATPVRDPEGARSADLETATLAALYMRQGLMEQAIGIYERLLARDPYNARLAAALESARQRGKDETRPEGLRVREPAPESASAPECEPAPESASAPECESAPESEPVPDPAVPAVAPDDEPIGEFLDALLEGRAPVDDRNGRRADWPEWLADLGSGDA